MYWTISDNIINQVDKEYNLEDMWQFDDVRDHYIDVEI